MTIASFGSSIVTAIMIAGDEPKREARTSWFPANRFWTVRHDDNLDRKG
jgi:hypothetical protein